MSKTQKQSRAARSNAQKSTGPKTTEGKAASSQNAVKHGLYAKSIIIDSPQLKEDPDQYTQLLVQLHQELEPQGAMQNQLVRQIANCFWRKQRLLAAETAYLNNQMDNIKSEEIRSHLLLIGDYDPDDEESMAQLQNDVDRTVALDKGKYSIPCERFAQRLLRYERHLDRQLTRTYKLLRDLKKHASPPAPPFGRSRHAPRVVVPDDAITDNRPFQGLADLEADPALVSAGEAVFGGFDSGSRLIHQTQGLINQAPTFDPPRSDTPWRGLSGRRGGFGGFEDRPALQKPKNEQTNLSRGNYKTAMHVQRIFDRGARFVGV